MMKRTKRILALLLTAALAAGLLSTAAMAAGGTGLTLEAASKTAKAGETVDVAVNIASNPGFVALDLSIGYDASALTLDSVTVASGFPATGAGDETGLTTINNETAGTCGVIVDAGNSSADLTATGTLLTLRFTVAATAKAGNYPIRLTVDSAANNALASVAATTTNGAITVKAAELKIENLTGSTPTAICTPSPDGKTLNVQNDKACMVLVKQTDAEGNVTYTRLPATANAEGGYDFDISSLPEGASLVVAVKGDVNGDGSVGVADRLMLAASLGGSVTLGNLAKEVSDVNNDGSIGVADRLMLAASLGGSTTLTW